MIYYLFYYIIIYNNYFSISNVTFKNCHTFYGHLISFNSYGKNISQLIINDSIFDGKYKNLILEI